MTREASDDIVQRLLAESVQQSDDEVAELVSDAADEIEHLRGEVERLRGAIRQALADLDAEHIHLHRQPDGTWHAVPMEPYHGRLGDGRVWLDAPADPDDGGNERQWREDDVADSYEDDPEDGAR